MASWTDAITQFNPYVSTLPVDAMVKVGQLKQAQYEQGVQKIQSQIDKVAGMDVLRDVDKNYLQSKLNELGGNLRTVAAGDFSDFQLVNSVGGMAKQITRDKNIQNAVGSTAWYRKQAQEMESAIKQGKSSQSNIWDFNTKASKYISSQNLDDTFSERYVPYTDYQKKWTDVLGKLHSNLTQEDITNVMDANGNIDHSKLAAAMTRVKDEGISATQIENAIKSSLRPDDIDQMTIDGRYEFRGASVEQLQKHYQNIYDSQVKTLDGRIAGLQGIANSSGSKPVLKNKALATIDELNAKKVEMSKGLQTRFDDIVANPEQAKGDIYKDGAISEFANSFSWEHRTLEKMTNPELDAAHWEKTYGLQVANAQLERDKFGYTKWIDKEKLGVEKQKLDIEISKLYGSASGFTTYLGEGTTLKDPKTAMQMDANQADLVANTVIQNYAKKFGKTIAAAEEDYKKFIGGDKTAIDVTYREQMDVARDSRIKAASINAAIKTAEDEVFADPTIAVGRKAFNASLNSKQGLDITVNGKIQHFTPKELWEYINKEKVVGGVGETAGGDYLSIDQSGLNDKEKALYSILGNTRYSVDRDRLPKNKNQQIVSDVLSSYNELGPKFNAYNTAYNTALADKIRTKAGKYIPSVANINVSNKDGALSRDNMEGIIGSVLLKYNDPFGGTPGGSAELSNSDALAAQDMLASKDKDNIQYKKVIQGDKTYALMLLGSKQVLVPLTSEEAKGLPKSKNEPSQQEVDVKYAQQLGGGNTNVTSRPEQSYFQTNKFVNVRNLSVTADLNANASPGSGLSYINLNIKTPSGWKNLQLDDNPMDVPTATNRIGSLTDMDIKLLYLANPNVPESWKEEIRNL